SPADRSTDLAVHVISWRLAESLRREVPRACTRTPRWQAAVASSRRRPLPFPGSLLACRLLRFGKYEVQHALRIELALVLLDPLVPDRLGGDLAELLELCLGVDHLRQLLPEHRQVLLVDLLVGLDLHFVGGLLQFHQELLVLV